MNGSRGHRSSFLVHHSSFIVSEGRMDFRLPALGEGIDSATVTAVLVKPGDTVAAGQNVIAVETDKAAMEIESDAAGTVEQVHVKPGDKLPVGAPVLKLGGPASGGGKQGKPPTATPPPA